MKKMTLLLIVLFALPLQSQIFFDGGIKGGFGGSFLYNKNVLDDGEINHKLSPAYTFGGKVSVNFTMSHALTFDVMVSRFEQKYNLEPALIDLSSAASTQVIGYNAVDFFMLYRKNAAGQYIELGGVYSIVNQSDNEPSVLNGLGEETFASFDPIDKNRMGAVLGFGSNIAGGHMSLLMLGVRIRYDINDVFNSEQNANIVYGKTYDSYQKSNPLSAMLVLEFNYGLGYFAQRSCPKRVKYFNYE